MELSTFAALIFLLFNLLNSSRKYGHHENQKMKTDIMMDKLEIGSPKQFIKDPHISQTKGRKKDDMKETEVGRIKSGFKISLNKIRSYQFCG